MKSTTDGIIALHVEVKVSPHEMRDWSPGRIEQFFKGLAMAREAAAGEKSDDRGDERA